MKEVRIHAATRRELIRAAGWYERQAAGLARDFRVEVGDAIERAARDPGAGAPYLGGTRSVQLHRFPYRLVYAERPHHLWFVALAHHRRREGYWRKRLPPP